MSKNKINVAVIGGGLSNERAVSLDTSKQIFSVLSKKKYNIFLIEIGKDKKWILKNQPVLNNPKNSLAVVGQSNNILPFNKGASKVNQIDLILKNIDVVFIALHGKSGEDGKIQAVLDLLGIPYTGSGVLASALGMNKIKCLYIVASHGIKVPNCLPIYLNAIANISNIKKDVLRKIGYPCVVKPNESGSSIGVTLVKNDRLLKKALQVAFKEDDLVLIEEYISGREFTCGILGNTNKTELISLPPVEIITDKKSFFDYYNKYHTEKVREVCPPMISKKLYNEIQKSAKKVHELLGCDGLSRSDFILSGKNNKLYFLEINTIPGQTENSLCPKEAKAMGWSFSEFIDKQISLALKKNVKRKKLF